MSYIDIIFFISRVQKIVVEVMALGEEMGEKVKYSDEQPPCTMTPQSTPGTTIVHWRSLDLSELCMNFFLLNQFNIDKVTKAHSYVDAVGSLSH